MWKSGTTRADPAWKIFKEEHRERKQRFANDEDRESPTKKARTDQRSTGDSAPGADEAAVGEAEFQKKMPRAPPSRRNHMSQHRSRRQSHCSRRGNGRVMEVMMNELIENNLGTMIAMTMK